MSNIETQKSVLVAMSGGVDSSVTALLLKQEGYDVTGVTFNLYKQPDPQHIKDAKKAADAVGVPHIVMHLEDVFHEKIIEYFIETYMQGKTPNPCSLCNKYIKFAALESKADELGIEHIATGHYAKLVKPEHGEGQRLTTSSDDKKSQEYFLALIPPRVLNRILFPLNIYQKPQVREIANNNDMKFFGEKKDSQEVCFLQNKTYVDFLEKQKNLDYLVGGDIIHNDTGKVLAKHDGFFRYTVGQRRGLGFGSGEPLYVVDTDPEKNSITVGSQKDVQRKYISVDILNNYDPLVVGESYGVKIRYKSISQTAKLIEYNSETNLAVLEATETFNAPSNGQIAVLYNNNLVIAAGEILNSYNEPIAY